MTLQIGHVIVVFLYIFPQISYGEREKIKIGGIFDSKYDDPEIAFKYAVEAMNAEVISRDFVLKEQTHRIDYGNEFLASQKLCRLLEAGSGVAAIFGPQSPTAALHVQSVCDAKEMTHVETRWSVDANRGPTINIHPHPETLSKVFIDMVKSWEWKTFTILYETGPYLPFTSDLLKYYNRTGYTVSVEQLNLKDDGNYRSVLQRVKTTEEKNLVLHCSIDILPEVLKQAQQVGIMTEHHQYFITSLDLHTIDIEPYQYSGTNITGIRLIDPDDPYIKHITDYFNTSEYLNGKELSEGLTPGKMRLETALMFDGVYLFAEALKSFGIELKNSRDPSKFETMSLKCKEQTTWKHGLSLYNYMKLSTVHGLTRTIKFDEFGHRSDFLLDVLEINQMGIVKVGTWDRTEHLKMNRTHKSSDLAIDDGTLRNKTFVVITVIKNPPYGMLKETAEKLSGNDRFEGFGIDLIHELSLMLGFNYTFRIQEDGAYGSLNQVTKQWNGMIRELHEYRADLAITDLTITAERESAADFTMPFMNLGISILFRKPTKEPPSTFSFMAPFSKEVWAYLGGAYLIVSFSLFILGRLSPKEWDNPYACIDEPEFLETQFSLSNAMWFTIGALLQQGSEIAPKAASTRTVASIWWFFTLIMVSSYTANLAAFLTVEPTLTLIENAEQLEKLGGKIKYGAKKDGSTLNFFKNAEYETYKRMYAFMNSTENVLTSSNEEGLEKVKKEHYAYLMESTSIEYYAERECNTSQVGGLLDEKGYGIAMRKESPYRNALSEAVLRLQEQGKLTKLKTKWWKEKKGGGACSSAASDSNAEELGLENVGGVFYVVLMGCVVGFLYGITEWFFSIVTRARENKVPFKEEFIEELKFVVKCHGNVKQVRHRKSSSNDSRNISQRSLRSHSAESKEDIASRRTKKEDLNI